jgi:hypothetical protein
MPGFACIRLRCLTINRCSTRACTHSPGNGSPGSEESVLVGLRTSLPSIRRHLRPHLRAVRELRTRDRGNGTLYYAAASSTDGPPTTTFRRGSLPRLRRTHDAPYCRPGSQEWQQQAPPHQPHHTHKGPAVPSGPRDRPAIFGLPSPRPNRSRGSRSDQRCRPLTGTPPAWQVPKTDEEQPTTADLAAAAEINERYQTTLDAHFTVYAYGRPS